MLLRGRPAWLSVLDYGLFRVHAGPRDIGIMGAAIGTDAGEVVLVDTGFPAKYARDPVAAAAEDRLGSFGTVLCCTPRNLPAAQLALLGLKPADVTVMVQTHTHIDHIGGIAEFPQAVAVIAAAERALPRPRYWTGGQPPEWPDRAWHLVEDDGDLGPGLRLLLVPGHAAGQLALLAELPQSGPVLWTSDAISRPAEIDEGFATADDPPAARSSAARLMALARDRGARVVWGHDPAQWSALPKAPRRWC
ncbi:MAG: N-acyl homoserine lactonase family protein [Gemmobacter sp.]